jgi:hypothetical protein
VLDEVSTAIPGGEAAGNGELTSGGLVTAVFQKNEESVNSIFDQNATGLAV